MSSFFQFACYHIDPHCLLQSVCSEVCEHSSVVRLISVYGCDTFLLPARSYRFNCLSFFGPVSLSNWVFHLPSRWEIKFTHVSFLKFGIIALFLILFELMRFKFKVGDNDFCIFFY